METACQEVEVGLRIDPEKGLNFFGLNEVNEFISQGIQVTLIEPVGALTRQQKDKDGNIQITISGFSVMVKFEVADTGL
jgi:hypothetical protein